MAVVHDFLSFFNKCRYASVLKETGWFSIDKWMDIRGNHDSFIHYPGEHPFKTYTVYGASGEDAVYEKTFHTDSGDLRFVGIDANDPCFRHFNGFLSRAILDKLEAILSNSTLFSLLLLIPRVPTVLFTHYPLFTMDNRPTSSNQHTLIDLIRMYKPIYYLCGHIHSTLGGMIVHMHLYHHR